MAYNPLVAVLTGTHAVSPTVTRYHLLSAFEMHIGEAVRLPQGSEVECIIIGEDQATIKYRRYERQVMSRETRLHGAYIVAEVWLRGDTGWGRQFKHEMADESFRPHTIHEAGTPHRDEAEQRTRRMFEADCHRPGGGRFPLDNADRTAEGYTTDRMVKHWS